MNNSITFVKLDKQYYDTLKEWWHSDRVISILPADTFIIGPEFDNERAHKCYMGAGFIDVDEYVVKDGFFKGKKLHLMTRGREKQNSVDKNIKL